MFSSGLTQSIRSILSEKYKLSKISIRPIHAGISRLSNPVEITGVSNKGIKTRYFGKIIGYSDVFMYRSIQYLKNVYLQFQNRNPLFGVYESPEEMARGQYQTLRMMHRSGIPTAKPYGCHYIQDGHWLLVTEYLTAKPLSSVEHLDSTQIDEVFSYLRKMHKKKIFHGDFKPDNIVVGRKIYILDVGHLRKDALSGEKQAYDLACALCSLLRYQPADEIIRIAKKHYSLKHLRAAMQYLDLVQMRPDIHFNDEMKTKLIFHLSTSPRRFRKQKQ